MNQIAVLDYGLGNVRSVCAALEKVGCKPQLTDNRDEILDCHGLVIPGVGAFTHGMQSLKKKGLDETIHAFVRTEKPVLGICLGMQLLMSESHEFGITAGLNVIPGTVKKLTTLAENYQKLPNINWSVLSFSSQDPGNGILGLVNSDDSFYFIHSYAVQLRSVELEIATATFSGSQFTSVFQKDRVFGCQFHPEKSGPSGLKIMKRFAEICGDLND